MDTYGFCNLSLVAIRSNNSDKAEMTSQLLFGELFECLQYKAGWYKIRTDYDQYEGWIGEKQFMPVSQDVYQKMQSSFTNSTLDLVSPLVEEETGNMTQLILGSSLPKIIRRHFSILGTEYTFEGKLGSNLQKTTRKSVLEYARMYLGAPYLWGGRSPFGIDCSGLVQMVFKLNRIKLPRDAHQQAEIGETLGFFAEALPGDLAFFEDKQGKIIHTGIIIEKNHIIHASGKVRIDRIDHDGIFNLETNSYTHKLRLVKRLLP